MSKPNVFGRWAFPAGRMLRLGGMGRRGAAEDSRRGDAAIIHACRRIGAGRDSENQRRSIQNPE
jgi:5-carboxymethyl-2-hydroxymuconate isomerase